MNYTSIEQSKKLLELGLDASTADMFYSIITSITTGEQIIGRIPMLKWDNMSSLTYIPCWSVGALITLFPNSIRIANIFFGYELYRSAKGYGIDWWDVKRLRKLHENEGKTLIDVCFETIIWLLENNYINKEEKI